ncbi:hypothetical protein PoB_006615400 [Plakobranchus ocellatus]|uniref:Uncharacterized protein n=1 Tax=Plakobranchus ocellatus TaxID=259542 RepID=A0AAV4D652_9GAST|nr:hypothetical protein PoB_006615400 [Plakobranchus ocellatus]
MKKEVKDVQFRPVETNCATARRLSGFLVVTQQHRETNTTRDQFRLTSTVTYRRGNLRVQGNHSVAMTPRRYISINISLLAVFAEVIYKDDAND